MLLDFTVKNWMSYRDEADFNLTSSLERQHMETLSKLPGFRSKKALPIAAVYGGNASGKTALFEALSALREMVVGDVGVSGALPVKPFALEDGSAERPTMFDITFLAGKTVYRLVVEATAAGVLYESLEIVRESGRVDVYERDSTRQVPFTINKGLFTLSDHVEYAARSTRENQLFLGSGMAQNVSELAEPFLWFAVSLELIGVGSNSWSFATAAGGREGFLDFAGRKLAQLDTGISGMTEEPISLDAAPKDANLARAISSLREGEVLTLVMDQAQGDYGFEMITVRNVDGHPKAFRLGTKHVGPDGKERRFSLDMESSGTKRLMGLLPMLFELSEPSDGMGTKVFVVDELDRCLHTMLTSRLIEDYIASCGPDTRKQLLFTTHDLLLMDQSIMRRDEMYITQRGIDGCSELVGLAEFEGIRFDKDLIRSYLDGRFGGIPMLGEVVSHG